MHPIDPADTTRPHLHAVGLAPAPAPASASASATAPDLAPTAVIDVERAEAAVAELLIALGRDPRSPHLADTPRRVAESFAELLTPTPFEITSFPNDEGYDELVVVADIPFHSLCEHHLLPFRGVAHVGYLPGERIVGLSKLARVVQHLSRSLQVQERLTSSIADRLDAELAPRGLGVVLEAEHLCMTLRGVQAVGTLTTTSAFTGLVRDDDGIRGEFLARCGLHRKEARR